MSTEDSDNPTSLKQSFLKARAATAALTSPPPGTPARRPDSPEYQADVTRALAQWARVQSQIRSLALFSPNESADDLATSEIKFLATDYHLAHTWERRQQPRPADGRPAPDSMRARAAAVQHAIDAYLAFLVVVAGYGILDSQALENNAAAADGPILAPRLVAVLRDPHAGKLDLKTVLAAARSAAAASANPESTRAEKIARFKRERALESQVAAAERSSSDAHDDEDAVRAATIAGLQLLVLRTVSALDGLAMEKDLLDRFPTPPPSSSSASQPPRERVDLLRTSAQTSQAPLLNPTGKVLRPFTILPSAASSTTGARQAVLQRVQGTGQHLPTMTVEEYLDEEMKRGGIISGGGEASRKQDDDDKSDEEDTHRGMEAADRKTFKAREWDEFVEANPKGSGNTINRG